MTKIDVFPYISKKIGYKHNTSDDSHYDGTYQNSACSYVLNITCNRMKIWGYQVDKSFDGAIECFCCKYDSKTEQDNAPFGKSYVKIYTKRRNYNNGQAMYPSIGLLAYKANYTFKCIAEAFDSLDDKFIHGLLVLHLLRFLVS